jgi:hypothetical protein
LAGSGVQEIDGLTGVGLGKEFSAEAADIFHIENEVARELPLHAERIDVARGGDPRTAYLLRARVLGRQETRNG